MEPLEAGTEAPDFTLDSIDGTPISLSDYRGQVVLINFWTPT
jgi:peroxiredoxin